MIFAKNNYQLNDHHTKIFLNKLKKKELKKSDQNSKNFFVSKLKSFNM